MRKIGLVLAVVINLLFLSGMNVSAAEQNVEQDKLQKIVERWEVFWGAMHEKEVDQSKKNYYQQEYKDIVTYIQNLPEDALLWVQEKIVEIEGKPETEGEHWFNMNSMIQGFLLSRWKERMEQPRILVDKVLPIVMNTKLPEWMRAGYIYETQRILLSYRNKRLLFPEKDMRIIIDNLVVMLNDKINTGPAVKVPAIEILSLFGTSDKAVNSVINCLEDKNEDVIFTTLKFIIFANVEYGQKTKRFTNQLAYEKLLEIINVPDLYSQKVRDEAILAMGSLQFPEGKEILLKLFKEEKEVKRLEVIMRSLCAYGDLDLIELVLKRRYSEELKDAKIMQICNSEDAENLLKFAREKDGEMLVLALQEIKKMPATFFYLKQAFPLIAEKISHKDKWVRSVILDILEDKIEVEARIYRKRKDAEMLNKTLKFLKERLAIEEDEKLQNKIRSLIQNIENLG